MMTKETFVKLMNAAKTYWDKLQVLESSLQTTFEENFLTDFLDSVIGAMGNDLPGYDDLLYAYIWNSNFGRDEPVYITEDGKEVWIDTAGELYDMLIDDKQNL